jgi:N-acetylglutamate synthase-like GNAT family acetyltransferase
MRPPLPFEDADAAPLAEFLRRCDLTTSGIGAPGLRLWIDVDSDGRIVGSTGFEVVGESALLRSVAVSPYLRGTGRGTELAKFALDQLTAMGVRRVWLFSRRSGPFWEKLGFGTVDIAELAASLADTHQVRAFEASGQLGFETAWSRQLP